MLKWLKSLLLPKDPEFPRRVKEHWYCGKWYMYLGDLAADGQYTETTLNPDNPRWAIDKVAFNPYRTGHADKNTSGLIDGLIPTIQIGNKVGLYKQVGRKYRTSSLYDGAPWDDGYNIDLEFVRAINIIDARWAHLRIIDQEVDITNTRGTPPTNGSMTPPGNGAMTPPGNGAMT